jgi:hypothetical protein
MDNLQTQSFAKTAIGSLCSVVLVPSILAALDVPPSIIAAVTLCPIVAFWIWGYRPKPRHSIPVSIIAIAFLAGAIAFQATGLGGDRPTIDDVRISFVPERQVGQSIFGRVVVQNTSNEKMLIKGHRLVVSNDYVSAQGAVTAVPSKGSASFPVDSFNHLWRGGRIDFEAHYAFGKNEAKKAAAAVIDLPPRGVTLGRPIEPSECCERPKSNFEALATRDAQTADKLEGGFRSIVPEKGVNGQPRRMREAHRRRVFIFDAVRREVRFFSVQRDGWHELRLPLKETFDGTHEVSFLWHEPNGFMALVVDNEVVEYDLDTKRTEQFEREQ